MDVRHNRQCDPVPLLSSVLAKTEVVNIKEGRDGGVYPDARQLGSAIFNLTFLCKEEHQYLVKWCVGRKECN